MWCGCNAAWTTPPQFDHDDGVIRPHPTLAVEQDEVGPLLPLPVGARGMLWVSEVTSDHLSHHDWILD
jgi:hypothetical protein